MKHQNPQNKEQSVAEAKRPYEPPKAKVVPVKLDERLMQCDFSSYRVCGPNR